METFTEINDYFSDPSIESFCLTRREWQTLKAELGKSPNSAMPKLPEWKDLWNSYVSEYMSTHGMRLPEAGMRETHLGFYEHLVRQLSA